MLRKKYTTIPKIIDLKSFIREAIKFLLTNQKIEIHYHKIRKQQKIANRKKIQKN